MIVVDTNVIAYLFLPTDKTAQVESLLKADQQWIAPDLWRSEFRNILALYLRKKIIDFADACQIQRQAERLLHGNEYRVDSLSVLTLVDKSDCSAYDCEFVALAKQSDTKLITWDKKLRKAFPETAMDAETYLSTKR